MWTGHIMYQDILLWISARQNRSQSYQHALFQYHELCQCPLIWFIVMIWFSHAHSNHSLCHVLLTFKVMNKFEVPEIELWLS